MSLMTPSNDRLPEGHGPASIGTPFGQVTRDRHGFVHITATAGQLHQWATREGARWPCSVLADDRVAGGVRVTLDPGGNLCDADHAGVDDIPIAEIGAWMADVLALAEVAPPVRAGRSIGGPARR